MRDIMYLGCTPVEEECAQVGSEDYDRRARADCVRYIGLLRKTFGLEPEGASLLVKANQHDFGTYLEVVCKYDTDNEEAMKYAFKLENEQPLHWED